MAQGKTKGAISLVSIHFQDMLELLGKDYNGKVSISYKWLQNHTRGIEQFSLIKTNKVGEIVSAIPAERSGAIIPPAARPKLTEIVSFDVEEMEE